MNEDRLNDILKDKFNDYELDLPENDWYVVEERLEHKKPLKESLIPEQKVVRRSMWMKAVIGMAACLTGLLVGFALWNTDSVKINEEQATDAIAELEERIYESSEENIFKYEEDEKELIVPTTKHVAELTSASDDMYEKVKDNSDNVSENIEVELLTTDLTQGEEPAKSEKGNSDNVITEEDAASMLRLREEALQQAVMSSDDNEVKIKERKRNGLTVGLLASLDASSSSSINGLNQYVMGGTNGTAVVYKANSVGRQKEHHYMPVSFGFDVSYEVIKNLDVKVGLVYTGLYSTFITELDNGSQSSDFQQVHYLGVPVNLSYRFWNGKILSTYVSAGGTGEKGLVNTTTYKLAIKDKNNIVYEEKERQPVDGMQWSIGAALGLDVKLYSRLYMYIEPGFNWYIPNKRTPQPITIRSKNPYSFTLKAGLKIRI